MPMPDGARDLTGNMRLRKSWWAGALVLQIEVTDRRNRNLGWTPRTVWRDATEFDLAGLRYLNDRERLTLPFEVKS